MIRVAIIEDDGLMMSQVQFELERSGDAAVVLAAETTGQFFELLPTARVPEILLLDLELNGKNSIVQLSMIRRLLPDTKILIVTGHADTELLIQALREGANGYYLKGSETSLMHAIRITMQGGAYIEPSLAAVVVELIQNPDFQTTLSRQFDKAAARFAADFSKREIEMIHGLLQGLTYKEIAHSYNISINTVRHYIKSVYKKMGVSGKKELFRKLNQQIPE